MYNYSVPFDVKGELSTLTIHKVSVFTLLISGLMMAGSYSRNWSTEKRVEVACCVWLVIELQHTFVIS
jgi:hypothetical protein